MLCSIPPNTANYLQRIGRAGRATGTALIVAVVNQRPHDLFFYGRPAAMLRGKVDPPGCWLDASAVLVRQYLAYCFDSGAKEGVLTELPRSAKGLVEDLERPEAVSSIIGGAGISWPSKSAMANPARSHAHRRSSGLIATRSIAKHYEDAAPTSISTIGLWALAQPTKRY
jgi:ATP-dependent helicase YprA (DUF1998 family)